MKLTIEEHPERIKRFGHIKPGPRFGSVQCFAQCPGSVRTCTLKKGHGGPHVAHGRFRRVVAVWDGGIVKARKAEVKVRRAVRPIPSGGTRDRGLVATLGAFRDRIMRRMPSLEEALLLILGISMAGFAIDWALRIIGWK